MRLTRLLWLCFLVILAAPMARAEYFVLRSGQRLAVTSYLLQDGTYHLQIAGGSVEVPALEVASIEPEEVFTPIVPPPSLPTGVPFGDLIQAASKQYAVDADLIRSIIAAESNFNPKAISRKNARGLMQLLPETAAKLGVQNIFDPRENIEAGTHYVHDLLQRYNNNLTLALAAYNAGPDRVQQYGNVPPFAETVAYIRRVERAYAKCKSGAGGAASSMQNAAGSKAFRLSLD